MVCLDLLLDGVNVLVEIGIEVIFRYVSVVKLKLMVVDLV